MYISLIIGTIGLFVLTVCAVIRIWESFRKEIANAYQEDQFFELALSVGFLLLISAFGGVIGLTLLEVFQRMSGAM